MVLIENLIDELHQIGKELPELGCCKKIFDELITINSHNSQDDNYLSAKAFTSIINNVVNSKISYCQYLIISQTDLLEFLNTYDDRYLSNIENLLASKITTEITCIIELQEDIDELQEFVKDLVTELNKQGTNNHFMKLQLELEQMLEEFNEKYERGEYDD